MDSVTEDESDDIFARLEEPKPASATLAGSDGASEQDAAAAGKETTGRRNATVNLDGIAEEDDEEDMDDDEEEEEEDDAAFDSLDEQEALDQLTRFEDEHMALLENLEDESIEKLRADVRSELEANFQEGSKPSLDEAVDMEIVKYKHNCNIRLDEVDDEISRLQQLLEDSGVSIQALYNKFEVGVQDNVKTEAWRKSKWIAVEADAAAAAAAAAGPRKPMFGDKPRGEDDEDEDEDGPAEQRLVPDIAEDVGAYVRHKQIKKRNKSREPKLTSARYRVNTPAEAEAAGLGSADAAEVHELGDGDEAASKKASRTQYAVAYAEERKRQVLSQAQLRKMGKHTFADDKDLRVERRETRRQGMPRKRLVPGPATGLWGMQTSQPPSKRRRPGESGAAAAAAAVEEVAEEDAYVLEEADHEPLSVVQERLVERLKAARIAGGDVGRKGGGGDGGGDKMESGMKKVVAAANGAAVAVAGGGAAVGSGS